MNNATIGKVNDISGFFTKYNELNQVHFQSLFGENLTASDIETLDFCLSDLYGARFLQSRFNDVFNNQSASECMSRIVSISDRMFFENWLDTKRAIEKALTTDLEKPLGSERNGENSTENKLNAFDSETASDTDESKHSYSETKTYSNGKTATQNAVNQIDFSRNNDFLEIIINDVLSVACTSVYDDNYICERTSSGGGGEIDPELENRVEQCETDITNIKKLIPTTATEQNKLATMADVQSGYDDTEIRGEIAEINENINGIYDDLTGYATKAELQNVESQIPDTSTFATKAELQAVESQIPDTSTFATKAELQAVESQIPDTSTFATKAELQTVESQIPDTSNFATKAELQAVESQIPDTSNFATKEFVNGITLYKNNNGVSIGQSALNVSYPIINDFSEIKHIDVEYRISTTVNRILVQRFSMESTTGLRINNVTFTDTQNSAIRTVSNITNRSLSISDCTFWTNGSSSTDNNRMIITKIVVYKY